MRHLFQSIKNTFFSKQKHKKYIPDIHKVLKQAIEQNNTEQIMYLLHSPELLTHPDVMRAVTMEDMNSLIQRNPELLLMLYNAIPSRYQLPYLEWIFLHTLNDHIDIFKKFIPDNIIDILDERKSYLFFLAAYYKEGLENIDCLLEKTTSLSVEDQYLKIMQHGLRTENMELVRYVEQEQQGIWHMKRVDLHLTIANNEISEGFLDNLIENSTIYYNVMDMINTCIYKGNITAFQYLYKHIVHSPESQKILLASAAAYNGQLAVLKFMHKHDTLFQEIFNVETTLFGTMSSGDMESFEYVHTLFSSFEMRDMERLLTIKKCLKCVFDKGESNSVAIINKIVQIYDLHSFLSSNITEYVSDRLSNHEKMGCIKYILQSDWVHHIQFSDKNYIIENLYYKREIDILKSLLSTAPRLEGVQEKIAAMLIKEGDIDLFTELSPFFVEMPPVEETELWIN